MRLVLIALTGLAISCSGREPGHTSLDPGTGVPDAKHFSLAVLDETFLDGGQAEGFSITIESDLAGVTVQVQAQDARGLKALFLELSYDPSKFNPVSCETTGLLGIPGETLSLSQFAQPGVVAHGQVLQNYNAYPGFNGSGTVATIRFEAKPFSRSKLSSAPPMSQLSAPLASWDPATSSLSWDYSNQGDYDQNGEVNIADLTPLALHYGESGEFDRIDALSVIDGDSNGEINLADITPIAINYQSTVTDYQLFYSTVEDVIPSPDTPNHILAPLAGIEFSLSEGDSSQTRLSFSYHLQQVAPNGWFWIQPTHSGELGVPIAETYECKLVVHDSLWQRGEATVTIQMDGLSQSDFIVWEERTWASSINLTVIAGVPCIAAALMYYSLFPEQGSGSLLFFRALDEMGTEWAEPRVIDGDIGLLGGWTNLVEVAGHPAVAWFDKESGDISYSRANDPQGDEWGPQIELGGGISAFGGAAALAVIDGLPSVVYSDGDRITYRRAEDNIGEVWNEGITIDEGKIFLPTLDLTEVDGSAGIIFASSSICNYAFLNSPDGSGGIKFRTIDDYVLEFQAELHVIQGHPAIISGRKYIRANDQRGLDWPDEINMVSTRSSNNSTLAVFHDMPMLFKGGRMAVAKDSFGDDWFDWWLVFDTNYWTEAEVVQDGIGVAYIAEPDDIDNSMYLKYSLFR